MFEGDFWLEYAAAFRQQAQAARESEQRDALLELANICLAVARHAEEHAPGG